jgi:hypothetical protein
MADKDKKKPAAPRPPPDDSSDSSGSDSEDGNFSEETLQRLESMKMEMEQYYQNLYKSMNERAERCVPNRAHPDPEVAQKAQEARDQVG